MKYQLTTTVEPEFNIPVMNLVADVPEAREMPRVLVLHGLYGAKHDWLPYMYVLAQSGFSVYSIDLCMHGDWPDTSRRDDLMATNFAETIRHIIYDTAKMIRRLLDTWSAIKTPISLVGISAGGFVAHVLATEERRFNAMVVVASSPDWTTADPTKMPPKYSPVYKLLEVMSPVNHAKKYAPLPLLMVNGDADMTVRHEGSVKLYGRLSSLYRNHGIAERVQLTLYPGVPHEFTEAMRSESIVWLKRFADK